MNEVESQALRLQENLDRIAAGERVEVVLARLGGDQELAELVALAAQMTEVVPVVPRLAFRARLQATLQGLMVRPDRRGLRLWPRMLPRLVALCAAVVLAVWSAAVVSADSLPGDTLYGLKLAAERTRLVLAVNPASRARVHLDMADARLVEIQTLIDRGLSLPAALVEGLVEARDGALSEARATGDDALVEEVELRAEEVRQLVDDAVQDASPEVRPLLEQASAAMGPPVEVLEAPATATERRAPTTVLDVEPTPADTPDSAELAATLIPAAATPTELPPPTSTATVYSTSTPRVPRIRRPTEANGQPTGPPLLPTAEPSIEPTKTKMPNLRGTERAAELTREAESTETRTPRKPHRLGPGDTQPTRLSPPSPTAAAEP